LIPRSAVCKCPGTLMEVKVPPDSRNPWANPSGPFVTPTTSPDALIPCGAVETAPGTSIVVIVNAPAAGANMNVARKAVTIFLCPLVSFLHDSYHEGFCESIELIALRDEAAFGSWQTCDRLSPS